MGRGANRMVSVLAVAVVVVTGLTGCGGDELPSDGVARVGDVVITQPDFDRWFKVVVLSPFQEGEAFVAAPPDPPRFSNCVAAKKGGSGPDDEQDLSDSQLRKLCEREYARLKRETMRSLIEAEWVEQEAAARDITISAGLVDRLLEERKHAFQSESAYEQFMRDSGMTEDDARSFIKIEQLRRKLEEAMAGRAAPVSKDDVEEYYEKNKERFSQPERRDLKYVQTRTKANAEEAKRALEAGESWKTVVEKYSIDPDNSRLQAVKGPKLQEGTESLERAVYRTRKGEISGPVKTQSGWYVFEVTNVKAASQQSLSRVREAVAAGLREQGRKAAIENFHREYREKTICADEFKSPQCGNGPRPRAASEV